MKRIVDVIRKPVVIVIFLGIVQFCIYQIITITPYRAEPKETTYNAAYGYDAEYVSYIRQGSQGYWTVQENRGTRPSPREYAYPLFIFLGKLSAVTHIDPIHMYFLSKVAGGICIFLVTYVVVTSFFPPAVQGIALLLTLGVEVGPYITALFSGQGIVSPLFGMSIATRHFGLPHHTIGETLAILFFLSYISCLSKLTPWRVVLLIVLGVVSAAFVLPYVIIMSIAMCSSFGVLLAIRRRFRSYLFPTVLVAVVIGITAMFYQHEFSLGAPWNDIFLAEKNWYPDGEVLIRYFSSLLIYIPAFLVSVVCIPLYWKRLSWRLRELAVVTGVWTVLPFLLIPMFSRFSLPVANFRLIDFYTYLHTGLFASVGFMCFDGLFQTGSARKIIFLSVFGLMFIPSVALPVVYAQNAIASTKSSEIFVYIPNKISDVIHSLSNVPPGSGVLALENFGEIIADQESVRVFVGNTPGYIDWQEKLLLAQSFYSGRLSHDEAVHFLNTNDITYVFYGPYEKMYTLTSPLYPDILTPIAQNDMATLFRVVH